MANFYASQLRSVAAFIERLDKAMEDFPETDENGLPTVYAVKIDLHVEGDPFGHLIDEIGDAWSWVPPCSEAGH